MAQPDGHIVLDTRVDTKGIETGFTTIKSGASSVTSVVKQLGAAIGIAFGVSALVKFGKEAINLASDVQEVQNVVDVAFGSMSDKMEKFADTAIETYGISKLTAKRTGSTYMAMAKGMGVAEQEASNMALALTGLSADMASFYNVEQKYTDIALKSVFTGETETLKQYGIVMTQTNLQEFARQKGITKSIQAMTQQEQTMLRYQYVMNQTKLAQGDFARTQDSWANQTRILSERWKEMKIVWGDAFMTIGTLALPMVNNLVKGLQTVGEYAKVVARSIARIFGKEIKDSKQTANNISSAVSGQEQLAEATKKATKQAEKQMATFDEINQLSDNTKDTGNSENGLSQTAGLNNATEFITNSKEIEQSNLEKKFEKITKSLEPLNSGFKRLWKSMKNVGKVEFKHLKNTYNKTLKPMGQWLKNTVIPQALDTISNSLNNSAEPLSRFNMGLEKLQQFTFEGLQWAWENIFQPLGQWALETALPAVIDMLAGAINALSAILEGCKPTFQWFWDNVLVPIRDFLWDLIIEAVNSLTNAFNRFSDWAKENPEEIQAMADIILGFLAGLWVYNSTKKITEFVTSMIAKFKELGGLKAMFAKLAGKINLSAIAIGALAAGIIYLAKHWDKLTPAQRTITILGALAAALTAAAVAVAVFHTTWSVGTAAFAIAGGLGLLAGTYLFQKANGGKELSLDDMTEGKTAPNSISQYAKYATMDNPIPKLAKGRVLPPNKPFLAWVGDQKSGTNIETPLKTMIEAFNIALNQRGGGNGVINLIINGKQFAQATYEDFKAVAKQQTVYAR